MSCEREFRAPSTLEILTAELSASSRQRVTLSKAPVAIGY